MSERVRYVSDKGIGYVHMDDGKANALGPKWFDEMGAALDQAENEEISALVIEGRDGVFSAGLDTKVLPTLKPEELRKELGRFAKIMERVFLFPVPVIAAAGGHTLAGGMVLFLAADWRIAYDHSEHKYGLNEVQIGLPLSEWILAICTHSIPSVHHTEMILHGQIQTPVRLREMEVVNELVESYHRLEERAGEKAAELAKSIQKKAYQLTKRSLREPALKRASERSSDDLATLFEKTMIQMAGGKR